MEETLPPPQQLLQQQAQVDQQGLEEEQEEQEEGSRHPEAVAPASLDALLCWHLVPWEVVGVPLMPWIWMVQRRVARVDLRRLHLLLLPMLLLLQKTRLRPPLLMWQPWQLLQLHLRLLLLLARFVLLVEVAVE
jgi:hypothetical protein